MSGAFNALREGVAEQLRAAGLNAVTAMESAPAKRWREPAAAVSLSRVICEPGGFKDYLGVERDRSGTERELYGREAELTLAVDIFAPRDAGARACQEAAERTAEELVCRGAAGLDALELRTGQVEFLEKEGLYRQQLSCKCRAWLVAGTGGSGPAFADFEVKGRMR